MVPTATMRPRVAGRRRDKAESELERRVYAAGWVSIYAFVQDMNADRKEGETKRSYAHVADLITGRRTMRPEHSAVLAEIEAKIRQRETQRKKGK